jgi:hypothetical protein
MVRDLQLELGRSVQTSVDVARGQGDASRQRITALEQQNRDLVSQLERMRLSQEGIRSELLETMSHMGRRVEGGEGRMERIKEEETRALAAQAELVSKLRTDVARLQASNEALRQQEASRGDAVRLELERLQARVRQAEAVATSSGKTALAESTAHTETKLTGAERQIADVMTAVKANHQQVTNEVTKRVDVLARALADDKHEALERQVRIVWDEGLYNNSNDNAHKNN